MDNFKDFFKHRYAINRIGMWVLFNMYKECAGQIGYSLPDYKDADYLIVLAVRDSIDRIESNISDNESSFLAYMEREVKSTCEKLL